MTASSPVSGTTDGTLPIKYAGLWRRSMAALIDGLIFVTLLMGALVAFGPRVAQINDTAVITMGGKSVRLSELAAPHVLVRRTDSETITTETTTATVGLQTIRHVVTRTTYGRSGSPQQPTSTSSSLSVYPSSMAIVSVIGLWLLYMSVFEASRTQATLGKLAMLIRVADEQGRRVTIPRALARNTLKLVSALPLFTGFMMAGWTAKKQALHDRIAQCIVHVVRT